MARWSALGAVFPVVLWMAGIWHPLALALPAPALLILFAYAPRMH